MNVLPNVDNDTAMALIHAACALVCLSADRIGHGYGTSRHWSFWSYCTLLLLLVALNAVLQLDQDFVVWVRTLAKSEGWYELRRPLQMGVLLALAAGASAWIFLATQNNGYLHFLIPIPRAVAGFGIFILLTLLSVRFVNLHYTDQLLNWRIANLRVGRLTELLGLVFVATGGMLHIIRGD